MSAAGGVLQVLALAVESASTDSPEGRAWRQRLVEARATVETLARSAENVLETHAGDAAETQALARLAADLSAFNHPEPPDSSFSDTPAGGGGEPPAFRDILDAIEHCVSAADEGEDFAVSRPMLDALTTLGLLQKAGRGRWSVTTAGEQLAAYRSRLASTGSAPAPSAVPEGFALVPVEPTDEILAYCMGFSDETARRAYAKMLAAAATTEQQP